MTYIEPKYLRTIDEIVKEYHTSRTTVYWHKIDCLNSPYKDAILYVGHRVFIDDRRWQEFERWHQEQKFIKKCGGEDLRNSKQYLEG